MFKRFSYWMPLLGFAVFSTLFGHIPQQAQRIGNTAVRPAASQAPNGVHIDFVDENDKPATQMYVSGDTVRIESGNAQGNGVIYNAATHTMTLLMPLRKSYMLLDRKSAAQVGSALAAAQKQMQAELAKLPQAQRTMMEKMMSQNGMGGGHPRIEIRNLKTMETVAGHRCHDQQVVTNGVPNLKMCVAPTSSLNIPAADLSTLKNMREDMVHIMSSMGPMASAYSTMETQHGFAIKRDVPRRKGLKLVTGTETLKSITRVKPPASLFEIPAGYKRTSFQQMMQGLHPR